MASRGVVRVRVQYPSGVPAVGASMALANDSADPTWISAGVLTAVAGLTVNLEGVTQGSPGLLIRAAIEDSSGVRWGNTARVRAPREGVTLHTTIHLSRLHQELPNKFVALAAKRHLAKTPHGEILLEDLEEAVNALQCGLPSSGAAIAGRAVQGALRLRGELDGWWSPNWNEATLGTLLSKDGPPQVLKAIALTPALGSGYLVRLRASVLTRNMAVHQHWTRLSLTEAVAGWIILTELVNAWFGPPDWASPRGATSG